MININALTRKNFLSSISKKRKNLLLLTSFLLTQTAPVWAMNTEDWNAEDEAAMLTAGHGQQRSRVILSVSVPFTPSEVDALKPFDPLPVNWGRAQQKVSCEFSSGVVVDDIILPTEYPLDGQWFYQEDRAHTQTLATLKLSVRLNNHHLEVFQRQVEVLHKLINQEEEVFS